MSGIETVWPHRLRASEPPSALQIVERQNEYVSWTLQTQDKRQRGSEPEDFGPDSKYTEGMNVIVHPTRKKDVTVQMAREILQDCINERLFNMPAEFEVEEFGNGEDSILFRISTREPWKDSHFPNWRTVPRVLVLRFNLPWAPYYGTESEVATTVYVRARGVPAPQVFFFDSSANNRHNLEFTIMELIEGNPLYLGDPRSHTRAVVRHATWVAHNHWMTIWNTSVFEQCGSIYRRDTEGGARQAFVGPMVCPELFAPRIYPLSINTLPRFGPFEGWEDSMRALIQVRRERDLRQFTNGELFISKVPECPINTDHVLNRIERFGPHVPERHSRPRMTHSDLHAENVLVAPEGAEGETRGVSGIIDWDGTCIEPAALCRSRGASVVIDGEMELPDEDERTIQRKWHLPIETVDEMATLMRWGIHQPILEFYARDPAAMIYRVSTDTPAS